MVAEVIVRFDHLDVVDLRRLQNLAGRFGAGNIRGRAHLAPFLEGAADAKLRPQTDDQRKPNQQQPVRTSRHRNRMDNHMRKFSLLVI